MSALDADFLDLERPEHPLHIASIIPFAGALYFERLSADVAARLHLVPRYTQRAVPLPLGFAFPFEPTT